VGCTIKVANQGASVVTTPPFAGDTASAGAAWPSTDTPASSPAALAKRTLEITLVLLTFPSRVILIAAPGIRPTSHDLTTTGAAASVRSNEMGYQKAAALASRARAMAVADPDRAGLLAAEAEETARSIDSESQKAWALASLATAMAAIL